MTIPGLYVERKDELVVAVGALLHDVGKLLHSAGDTNDHASGGSELLNNFVHEGSPIFKWTGKEVWEQIVDVVKHHHHSVGEKVSDSVLQAVKFGDWISSSEREEEKGEFRKRIETRMAWNPFFDRVKEEGGAFRRTYIDPVPFSADEFGFSPGEGNVWGKNLELFHESDREERVVVGFKRLAERLKDDIGKVSSFHDLLALLEQTTKFVPSSVREERITISLYDHLRTASALALAIYKNAENSGRVEMTGFGLVRFSFFHIQRFIANLKGAKGASSFLRGNSLLVSLLNQVVAHWLLRKYGLSEANLVYWGGGTGVLVVPAKDAASVSDVEREVAERLFGLFGTDLGFGMAGITYEEWQKVAKSRSEKGGDKGKRSGEDLGGMIGELVRRTAARKLMEFSSLAEDEARFDELFRGGRMEGLGECDFCGRECRREDLQVLKDHESSEELGLGCPVCRAVRELQKDYKSEVRGGKGVYWIIEKPQEGKEYDAVFGKFGFGVRFGGEGEGMGFSMGLPRKDRKEGKLRFFAFSPLLRYFPERAAFDELASVKKGEKEEREVRAPLAYLKADVDNLGRAFTRVRTLAEYSHFSSFISLFFSEAVSEVLKNDVCGEVYPVFAGGDDVFFVARYDGGFSLARALSRSFLSYADPRGLNSAKLLTLSAGFSLFHSRFPLWRASTLVEEELERAKSRVGESGKVVKDGISLWGYVFSWEELEEIEKLRNKLVFCCFKEERGERKKRTGPVRRVRRFVNAHRSGWDSPKAVRLWVPKVWSLLYGFRDEKDEAVRSVAEELKTLVIEEFFSAKEGGRAWWALLDAASRLAEFDVRFEIGENVYGGDRE